MKTKTNPYLGVDVSKSHLDFDLPAPLARIANTESAVSRMLGTLPPQTHLVCEPTGGYEQVLVNAAQANGMRISVISPQRVRHHARSCGQLAKSDRIDAVVLTDFGRKHEPAPRAKPEPERQQLRELLRARTQLIELQKIEASWREHPATLPLLRKQAEQRAQLLEQQLQELTRQIRLLTAKAPNRSQLDRLKQIQGVGEITAWTVWAEMPELGTMESGQPAALAGLAPYARDSGKKQGRRYTQAGRPQVRRVLYMAALSASRYNPVLREVYQRLLKRGKAKKTALIALARKLIELINLMLKKPEFLLAA